MKYSRLKKAIPFCLLVAAFMPDVTAQGIHITQGCNLIVAGAAKIVLNDAGFTNEGKFTPGNSTVIFTGVRGLPPDPANVSFIKGTAGSTIPFFNLQVNKTFAGLSVKAPISVTNSLIMTKGNIELTSGNGISLGSTGLLAGESEQSHFTGNGSLLATPTVSAPVINANPGNLGLEITNSSGLGFILLSRGIFTDTLSAGRISIRRRYTFVPLITPSLNATIRYHYLQAELNGNAENNLALWSSLTTATTGQWVPGVNDSLAIGAKYIQRKNVTQLRYLTAGPSTTLGRIATTAGEAPAATVAAGFSFRVLPNPARDRFTLAVTNSGQKEDIIGLYDLGGHLLQTKTIHCEHGTNYLEWDISAYPAGIYYLHFEKRGYKNAQVIKQ